MKIDSESFLNQRAYVVGFSRTADMQGFSALLRKITPTAVWRIIDKTAAKAPFKLEALTKRTHGRPLTSHTQEEADRQAKDTVKLSAEMQ
jgi:hypothetical protein